MDLLSRTKGKPRWNFSWNLNFLFEYVVGKISAILLLTDLQRVPAAYDIRPTVPINNQRNTWNPQITGYWVASLISSQLLW